MIISHKHRFIFIHCRKAAGSAISVLLTPHLGPRDVQIGLVGAHGSKPNANSLFRLLTARGGAAFIKGRMSAEALNTAVKASYNHVSSNPPQFAFAEDIRRWYPDAWEQYYKFCVVRNPFDRVVSDYYWRTRNLDDPPSFAEYVTAMYRREWLGGIVPYYFDNWPLYTIGERVAVDKIVRYEDLIPGLRQVFKAVRLDWDGVLPRAKVEYRAQKAEYRSLYDDRLAEMVHDIFRKEIDEFGYAF